MSSVDGFEVMVFDEAQREEFNYFVIHGIAQNTVGKISAERLIKLDDGSGCTLFDEHLRKDLIDYDGPDIPIAPGLRNSSDFIEGDEYYIKSPFFKGIGLAILGKIMESEVQLDFPDQTKLVAPFNYAGLVSVEDYNFYDSNRPGRGSVYSSIGFNLELTRMLSGLGIINYNNYEIVRKMKRIFEVNAREYRHRTY